MNKYLLINKLSELKIGDYVQCHIYTNPSIYQNEYIIRKGIIQKLDPCITNIMILDNYGKEIPLSYYDYNTKGLNINIYKQKDIILDYIPDGIMFNYY
jgi:hypothetical protein